MGLLLTAVREGEVVEFELTDTEPSAAVSRNMVHRAVPESLLVSSR